MTSRATQTTSSASPSIPKVFRYVEWLSLGIPALRMLFPMLYEPLAYDVNSGDFLVFGVLGIFAILSLRFPIDRPMWQRRLYIWFEIGCLLATRVFSHWGFDLLLWLVFAKSFFLLSRREGIVTILIAGVAWQVAIAHYFAQLFTQPEVMQAQMEALETVPISIQVADIVLNSTTVFIAANSLIILLCLTIISERKSRQRETALAQEVELLAADLERNRIARDIHDSLGHTLTSLDVQIELAQRLYERGSSQAQQALDTSKVLASQSLQEVRRSVTTMRQEAFDLENALHQLLEPFRRDACLTVKSHLDLPSLPLQTSHQLYCMIKEALENIRKHSQAQSVHMMGKIIEDCVILSLEDDGIGFNSNQFTAGFGLQGMRERCQLIGGQIIIDSLPGRGTTIQITVSR